MRDVIDQLEGWWKNGEPVALATVVGTWRSSPRQAGASMLVGPGGEAVGSVSGGCVEGAVYELGQQVLAEDRPVLQRYGVSDDDAFSIGLTCGGILDIFVEKVTPETYDQFGRIADAVRGEHPVAVATVVTGPAERLGKRLIVWPDHTEGGFGSDRIDDAVRDDARGLLDSGRNALMTYGVNGERRGEGLTVFVESFAPPPRMIVFGAIDFAAAVAKMGTFLGFRVTVCDARPVFATATRFPGANEVVVEWPHRYLQAEADAGPDRPADGAVRAHPRPEVRRAAAGGGAAAAGGRLHRGDGLATHARRPDRAAPGAGRHRSRDRQDVLADRARPRRPHPGGDRGVDRRRDDRPALGRRGNASRGAGGPDPRRLRPDLSFRRGSGPAGRRRANRC